MIKAYGKSSAGYNKQRVNIRDSRGQSNARVATSTYVGDTVKPQCGMIDKAVKAINQYASIVAMFIALTAACAPSAAQASNGLRASDTTTLDYASFGSVEISADAPTVKPKATDLFYRTAREHEVYSLCDREDATCPPEVRSWRASVARLNGLAGLELLTAVNTAVNQLITYRDDLTVYGKEDHWATPMESLSGYGDCEDYAFVKYLSLLELGIPHESMRIVILKDNARNIGHAVLAVSFNDRTYILDNVVAQPTPDSALPHYQPIYSFNMDQHWLNVAVRSRTVRVAASDTQRAPITVIPPAAHNLAGAASAPTDTDVE